ncbi:MAG: hypothetical protein IPL49_12025 [Saprospirales bacterium]|nr:hypothetical protein [Saprospirales bacterium]MBK8491578.1 hypothetical protein [Saprospirales bacterium]
MPKTPSDRLFNLIHSLTGSEKRYFKLFAREGKGGDNKYLRLFEAIEQQTEFDEEELKQAIYGSESIESRKYSELKSYLFEWVLKSLQAYDEKTSADYRIKSMLLGVRALFRRSRYEDALYSLNKVRKIAWQYEHFTSMVEVVNWEKQIAYARTDIAFLDAELARIEREEREYLTQLDNLATYRNIFLQLLTSLRKDASMRREEQTRYIEELLEHPQLQHIDLATSHQARIYYYRILSVASYARKDYPRFYELNRALIGLMEERPDLLREDVSEYISALSNMALSCGYLQKIEELRAVLKKFKQIRPNTPDDELKIHRQYYMNKFGLSIAQGDFEEGLHALEEHQEEVQRFSDSFFRKNTFYYQYFYIYFGIGNYEQALAYLNEWLSLSGNIERKDLQSVARILNLIIHFEMGNTLLLESLIRSTQRFLQKEERMFEYERAVLQFIKASTRAVDKGEEKKAFQLLQTQLESLYDKPSERPMLDLFDIQAWVESHIRQIPFGDVVRLRQRSPA